MDQRDSGRLGAPGNFSKSLIRTHSWTVSDRRVSFIVRGTHQARCNPAGLPPAGTF